MAQRDLQLFLEKVNQLQKMVKSLDKEPSRKALLAECENHNQVIELAEKWGFQIGRRWGEPDTSAVDPLEGNLLASELPAIGNQRKILIKEGLNWQLELTVACASSSAKGIWRELDCHLWILVLKGSVAILFKGPESFMDLSVGDQYYIKRNRQHRIERTDPPPGTIWLELKWQD